MVHTEISQNHLAQIELMQSAQSLDNEALVSIFDTYAPLMYRYALRLCRDDVVADDIVGEVFVKLLSQYTKGSGPNKNLRSYLYETTYNTIVDRSRRTKNDAPFEAFTMQRANPNSQPVEEEVNAHFDQELLLKAIDRDLSEPQRHVIILHHMEGLKLYEIAQILGLTLGNVKVIHARAKEKLKRVLEHKLTV